MKIDTNALRDDNDFSINSINNSNFFSMENNILLWRDFKSSIERISIENNFINIFWLDLYNYFNQLNLDINLWLKYYEKYPFINWEDIKWLIENDICELEINNFYKKFWNNISWKEIAYFVILNISANIAYKYYSNLEWMNISKVEEMHRLWYSINEIENIKNINENIYSIFTWKDINWQLFTIWLELIEIWFPFEEISNYKDIIWDFLVWEIEWFNDLRKYNAYHLIVIYNIFWDKISANQIFEIINHNWSYELFKSYFYEDIWYLINYWLIDEYLSSEKNISQFILDSRINQYKTEIDILISDYELAYLINNWINPNTANEYIISLNNFWLNWEDITYLIINNIGIQDTINFINYSGLNNISWFYIATFIKNNITYDEAIKVLIKTNYNENLLDSDIILIAEWSIVNEELIYSILEIKDEIYNKFWFNWPIRTYEILLWEWFDYDLIILNVKYCIENNLPLSAQRIYDLWPTNLYEIENDLNYLKDFWITERDINEITVSNIWFNFNILAWNLSYVRDNNIDLNVFELIEIWDKLIDDIDPILINEIWYENIILLKEIWVSDINIFYNELLVFLKNSIKVDWFYQLLLKDIFSMEWFLEVFNFIITNKDVSISIWNKEYIIYWNKQLLISLISHYSNTSWVSLDMNEILFSFEKKLNEYINTSNNIDKVIYLWAWLYSWEDYNWFTRWNKNLLNKKFPWIDILDYSTWSELWKTINSPSDFIDKLEEILSWTNENIYLEISLHWWINWTWLYSWINFEKSDFLRIRDLWNNYPNLKIVINSCHSLTKFDENNDWIISHDELWNWNILLNSLNNASTDNFINHRLDAYSTDINWNLKWDFNWDWIVTLEEAIIYSKINYQDSVLQTSQSWFNSDNWIININNSINKIEDTN